MCGFPRADVCVVAIAFGCGCSSEPPLTVVAEDGVDLPLARASAEERTSFVEGDGLFDVPFRRADGLGPVFIRTSCGSCHEEGLRGPGFVQKMVILEDGEPLTDQSALPFGHTVRPYVSGGGSAPIEPPTQGWPDGAELHVTSRMPPTLLGRGYIEAIADAEIERVEREQQDRDDSISGRIARVKYGSVGSVDDAFHSYDRDDEGLIGRFGLKARQPTLDDFAADAFQGDMGLTSPLRPEEVLNPDGLEDDAKPGVDVDIELLRSVTTYVRLIEIPNRDPAVATERALALFEETLCSACHVPTMRTRADYPITPLADMDARVYTDVLLHDLGGAYNDGLTDQNAGTTEWRTAPLIGLRFMRNYLHDGRALNVEDAIVMHDGADSEAAESVSRFQGISESDRRVLLAFVESL